MTMALVWLIAAGVFLALEAFGLSGVGLLFLGLGALIAGIAIEYGGVGADAYVLQSAIFLVSSSVFAALLWKKLKNWRMKPEISEYSNMIGDSATVSGAGLKRGVRGQVQWSGTTMQAEIDRSETVPEFGAGVVVKIVQVKGNVLYIARAE